MIAIDYGIALVIDHKDWEFVIYDRLIKRRRINRFQIGRYITHLKFAIIEDFS
jgi:hypothetical protein